MEYEKRKNATSRAGLNGVTIVQTSALNKFHDTTTVVITNTSNSDSNACRRYDSCNAPQCPLDRSSLESPYYSGEPVCYWLSEFAKGDHRYLDNAMGGVPIKLVAKAYERLRDTHGTIRIRLDRAKTTPTRLSQTGDLK